MFRPDIPKWTLDYVQVKGNAIVFARYIFRTIKGGIDQYIQAIRHSSGTISNIGVLWSIVTKPLTTVTLTEQHSIDQTINKIYQDLVSLESCNIT